MLLFSIIISNCEIMFFSCIPFNRSVCPLLKFFHFIKSFISFNRSVVVIDPYRSLYISFLPECLHVLLVHCNPFLMSFNLQGSSNVPCSSFLTECFQLRSSSLFSFFNLFNLARFFGFTHFSKKQLSFTLVFLFRCPSGAILDLGTRSSRSGGVL